MRCDRRCVGTMWSSAKTNNSKRNSCLTASAAVVASRRSRRWGFIVLMAAGLSVSCINLRAVDSPTSDSGVDPARAGSGGNRAGQGNTGGNGAVAGDNEPGSGVNGGKSGGGAEGSLDANGGPGNGAADPSRPCTPDDKRCDGQIPQTCSKDGAWVDTEPCKDQACTGKGLCTGECSPGVKKCGTGPDALTPFECEQGKWVAKTPACTNVCSNGTCGGSCVPTKVQCATGNKTETCSAMGTWEPGEACQAQTCVDGACAGVCAPTDKRCGSNNNPQTCDKGAWKDGAACVGKTCANGVCGGACAADAVQCASATSKQTCGSNGQWGPATPCEFACVGKDCGGVCKPGAIQCASNASKQTCGNDGQWGPASPCDNKPNQTATCNAGRCEYKDNCTPNQMCQADTECQMFRTTCPGGAMQCTAMNKSNATRCGSGANAGTCEGGRCKSACEGVTCNNHGTCNNGACTCDRGWSSPANGCKTEDKCITNNITCTHGSCSGGTCNCANTGFMGDRCDVPVCNGKMCGGQCKQVQSKVCIWASTPSKGPSRDFCAADSDKNMFTCDNKGGACAQHNGLDAPLLGYYEYNFPSSGSQQSPSLKWYCCPKHREESTDFEMSRISCLSAQ